ncbi:1-(5-phosphoribosyl)-5-[(5-phosphoribosylamino)methylideneamino] imidazole-4-carboxamide isomerase [Rhodobacteraceae bacterium NNCM2]|nr:1-(5-phosphoribosyl)-5-[(5-phosphoribosylamino)methylideneamino] imidazole-4-carboxamide isomerase [Coraliihabitans acroporae]
MIIYPAIELQNGRCVSHTAGRLDETSIWHLDPIEKAKSFAEAGAEWMQVTDLDAVAGIGSNAGMIKEIIRKAEIPVQVAGGIRTFEHVHQWAEAGAGRMIIGTAAVQDPHLVRQAAHAYPDQIVLSVDMQQGHVMIEGRTEATAFEPVAFVGEFAECPLAAILCTDIDRDMDAPGSSIALTSKLAEATQTPVISSGLVKTLDDVSILKYVYNIAGAVIGRAIFSHDIDLAEAIRVARAEPERIAEFQ